MRVKYVQHTLFKSYRLYPILLPRMFLTSCCTFQSEYVFTRQIQVRSFCLNAMLPFSASIPHQPRLGKAWDLAIFKEDLTHLCFPVTKTGGKRGPLSSDGWVACSRADAWAFQLCRTESQDLAMAWVKKPYPQQIFVFNLSRSTTQLTSLPELWFWQWFCCSSLAHMVRLWWPFIYSPHTGQGYSRVVSTGVAALFLQTCSHRTLPPEKPETFLRSVQSTRWRLRRRPYIP